MDSRDTASVRLLTPSTWSRGIIAENETWEGFPYTRVGTFFSELEFQRYKVNSVLKELLADVDIIQVVSGSAASANAVIGTGKPISLQVATRARVERRCRDASVRSPLDWWRRAMTEITDHYDNRALLRCHAIQVENSWMFDYVRKLNRNRSVDVRNAPPGVDHHLFHPAAERDPESQPYILCIGRLGDPRKRLELLGEAFVALAQRGDDMTKLVVAGKSAPPAGFWRLIDENGLRRRVTYLPEVSQTEIVTLYQQASVFALPSDEEGLGVVILEAMACGAPVVSTRSGGPEGIISDGVDGILVDRDDSSQLAIGLERVLRENGLNKAFSSAGRQKVLHNYSLDVTGQKFLDVWHSLLNKNNTSCKDRQF
ncbi:glycosyltransferase [Spiribacter sp. 1M153]|uniref:glycosyltransferase family 4 protein n=1 Tax=Spiribacter roseus TaxID=1855875 RepID=UPI00349FCB39